MPLHSSRRLKKPEFNETLGGIRSDPDRDVDWYPRIFLNVTAELDRNLGEGSRQMIIGLASDHAGKELKDILAGLVKALGHEVVDYGVAVSNEQSVDYPDYAALLAQDISSAKVEAGIAVCGSGIGMSITANKFPGVRAAVIWDEYSARMAKAHNNANVICLGSRTLNMHRAADFVRIWLESVFEGGRHKLRLDKIREIEKKNFKLP